MHYTKLEAQYFIFISSMKNDSSIVFINFTANGEIWVFNRTYTQYIPLSLYDLQSWMGSPSIFVYDCSNAGIIVNSFEQFSEQHERDYQAQVSWFLVFYNVMWKGKSEYIRKSKTCNMFESKTLTFHLGNAKCESKQIT